MTQFLSDICFKCEKRKLLISFYPHPHMGNGHLGKCKKCTKSDVADHRLKNRKRIMEYDRERSKLPHRKKLHKKIYERWKKKNPGSRRAQNKVNNALRGGELLKPAQCERCGNKIRIEGHHPDHRKSLVVKWLCNWCHKIAHGRIKYGLTRAPAK